MLLKNLLKKLEVKEILNKKDVEIEEIVINSKKATKNCLFICLKGNDYDGHDYVEEAKKGGAKAVVVDHKIQTELTQIVVEDTRKAMGIICSNFYGKPEKNIKFIGIVGTNGKTTTAHYVYSILKNANIKVGLIGTLGIKYGNKFFESNLTTPDPLEFYKIISEMSRDGITHVVMEVSAHAVYYDKLAGIKFEAGIFTNFSQDHLDFFKEMDNYRQAKIKFFNDYDCKFIITNSDDETGLEIAKKTGAITYGIKNPSDVFAIRIKQKHTGTFFIMNLFDCVYEVNIKMLGLHNVYNALAAATTCALLGIKTYSVVDGLGKIETVNGRLERIEYKKISVFIDYAHTPDGLEKTLNVLKPLCKGKLICVFGCGGNRDKTKRAKMGEIGGKIADFSVITTDNPRFEEPMDIINDIEKGLINVGAKYIIVQDRRQAIKYALNYALDNDFVLIAGKGGEKYQEVLGIKKPFSDKECVYELLEKEI